MAKVTAVILNYNSIEDSKKCAEFLKKQKDADLEIVIVDNQSTDGRVNEIESFCNENSITFIQSQNNGGYSAGNNVGLKYAVTKGSEIGLIINPDVEIRDEYYVSKAIVQMKSDKNIAVLGTDVLNNEGKHQNPLRNSYLIEDVFWPIVQLKNKKSSKLPFTQNHLKSGYCEKVSGCCFFIDLKFLDEIGYLDETVFMYSEEPILASIVRDKNKKEYYMHSISAYHMHKAQNKDKSKKNLKRLYDSRRYYLKNYSGYGKIRLKIAIISLWLQEKITTK